MDDKAWLWWLNPAFIWFLVGLIAMIGEITVPGVLLLFFGFGAWLTAALLLVAPLGPIAQVAVFLVASVGSLVLLRRKLQFVFYHRRLKHHNMPDALAPDFIGQQVQVTDDINPPHWGRVQLNGVFWQARASVPLPRGTMVEVVGRDELTLEVKPCRPSE